MPHNNPPRSLLRPISVEMKYIAGFCFAASPSFPRHARVLQQQQQGGGGCNPKPPRLQRLLACVCRQNHRTKNNCSSLLRPRLSLRTTTVSLSVSYSCMRTTSVCSHLPSLLMPGSSSKNILVCRAQARHQPTRFMRSQLVRLRPPSSLSI